MAPSSSVMLKPLTQRLEEVLPPASAGSGGGSGTAELGAAVCGALLAVAVAVGEARPGVDGAAVPDVDGAAVELAVADAEVLGTELVLPDAVAGAGAPWKSIQDSVRTVLPPTVTLSAFAVTV